MRERPPPTRQCHLARRERKSPLAVVSTARGKVCDLGGHGTINARDGRPPTDWPSLSILIEQQHPVAERPSYGEVFNLAAKTAVNCLG